MQEKTARFTADAVYAELKPYMDAVDGQSERLQALGAAPGILAELPVGSQWQAYTQDETVNPSGAFKMSGAAAALWGAQQETPGLNRVTASSAGNWGAAVAYGAKRLGVQAEVHVPDTISPAKAVLLEDMGATLVLHDSLESGMDAAWHSATTTSGAAFLHPYDNKFGIAGQSLVGLRILKALETRGIDLTDANVCIAAQAGGGSLLTGVAMRLRQARDQGRIGSNVRLCAVQPENCDRLLRISRSYPDQPETPCRVIDQRYDGLAVQHPGERAVAVAADPTYVHDVLRVSEADSGRAAHLLYRSLGKCIEPAGLVSTAAFYHRHAPHSTFVSIATGRNVTPAVFHDFSVGAGLREQRAALDSLTVSDDAFWETPALALSLRTAVWRSPVAL